MSKTIHRLKDSELRAALGKDRVLHDGGGLYFQSTAKGSASFHYRYQINNKQTKMGLGPYPELPLKDAREAHKYWQRIKAKGLDPKTVRDSERAGQAKSLRTLRTIIQEFFEGHKRTLKDEGEAGRWWSPINHHVLPELGDQTVETLTVERIVENFAPIWTTKKDTARKAFNRLRKAMEFARVDEPFDLQVLEDARAKLGPQGKHKRESVRALHWKDWPTVYAELSNSLTHTALKMLVLTVARSANLRMMRWDQLDLKEGIWTLSEDDTKTAQPFRIPLQSQALTLLSHARSWRDDSGFVFPVPKNKRGVLSENAFLQYFAKHQIDTTAHGIRSTVTDFLHENELADYKLAEMALAHQTKKEVTAAYFRSDMLDKRRMIMQEWADFVTAEAANKAKAKRDRENAREALDFPAEAPGKDGGARTKREVEEWLRPDPVEAEEAQSLSNESTA
ncbi:MAG: integrase arm-type DNA-binding domain-containing protein [Pseudomonadota bacterium]